MALSSAGRRKASKAQRTPAFVETTIEYPPSSGSPERISSRSAALAGFRTAPSAEYRRLNSLPPSSTSAPPRTCFCSKAENAEKTLLEQLTSGSFDAGEQLVEIYEKDNGRRNRDIVAVRRHQATLRRGEQETRFFA